MPDTLNQSSKIISMCQKLSKVLAVMDLERGIKEFSYFLKEYRKDLPVVRNCVPLKIYTDSGGCRISRCGGGRLPPTWALLGRNVCENERIGATSAP